MDLYCLALGGLCDLVINLEHGNQRLCRKDRLSVFAFDNDVRQPDRGFFANGIWYGPSTINGRVKVAKVASEMTIVRENFSSIFITWTCAWHAGFVVFKCHHLHLSSHGSKYACCPPITTPHPRTGLRANRLP